MTSIISPASRKDIADKLFSDFNLAYAGHSNGNYTVLRKPFENFRSYNDKFNALTSAFKRLYERASQEPISVLDIGCGAGYAIRQAIRDLEAQTNRPHSAVGITANVDYLKPFLHFSGLPSASLEGIFPGGYVLRTPKGSSIGFFTHEAHEPVGAFDLILSSTTFQHLALPWLAFQNACSSLRAGGMAIVAQVNLDAPLDVPAQFTRTVFEEIKRMNPAYTIQTHFNIAKTPFLVTHIFVQKKGDEPFIVPFDVAIDSHGELSCVTHQRDSRFISLNDLRSVGFSGVPSSYVATVDDRHKHLV